MAILIGLILFVLGTVLLFKGADWFMDGVEDLAPMLGISAVILGILLASLEPEEMLTAAIASIRGAPSLAIGNVIGTNVVITTLALGLSALIYPIAISHTVRRQAVIATLISIIPIAVLLTGLVSRFAGLLMVLLFIGYIVLLFQQNRRAASSSQIAVEDGNDQPESGLPDTAKPSWKRLRLLSITLGGLVTLTVGGSILVEGALRLAASFNLSAGIIGATVVSVGTGAEMIALGVSAARRRQAEILVGGIIGSFAYNLLVTLGIAAIIRPLPVDLLMIRLTLPFMIGAHLLLLALVWRGKISRVMAGLLIVVYVVYFIAAVIPQQ